MLKFCCVLATSATSSKAFSFFSLFLLRPLTVLIKQTRVWTIKQSKLLRCLWTRIKVSDKTKTQQLLKITICIQISFQKKKRFHVSSFVEAEKLLKIASFSSEFETSRDAPVTLRDAHRSMTKQISQRDKCFVFRRSILTSPPPQLHKYDLKFLFNFQWNCTS